MPICPPVPQRSLPARSAMEAGIFSQAN